MEGHSRICFFHLLSGFRDFPGVVQFSIASVDANHISKVLNLEFWGLVPDVSFFFSLTAYSLNTNVITLLLSKVSSLSNSREISSTVVNSSLLLPVLNPRVDSCYTWPLPNMRKHFTVIFWAQSTCELMTSPQHATAFSTRVTCIVVDFGPTWLDSQACHTRELYSGCDSCDEHMTTNTWLFEVSLRADWAFSSPFWRVKIFPATSEVRTSTKNVLNVEKKHLKVNICFLLVFQI
jgi:hypothetical protein